MRDTGIRRSPDIIDTVLIIIFLAGIYVGFSPRLAAGVPVPAAPAGIAGGFLLLKNYYRVELRHVIALSVVILLYLASIMCAGDYMFLKERFKGFIQITYSLVIGYGLFITIIHYDRDRLARIFLGFCLILIFGLLLETYVEPFRAFSNAVRAKLFDTSIIYDADLRDLRLYGRIRPKLFTSEPSLASFGVALFAFFWYALSTWRNKIVLYLLILAAGMILVRGPTLLLGIALIIPYQVFLTARTSGDRGAGYDIVRLAKVSVVSLAALAVGVFAATYFFAERIEAIETHEDASFFYRVTGPSMVAWDTIVRHPIAGAGLTGEEYIEDRVRQIYTTLPEFGEEWQIDSVAEAITNYFWYHWIYLGLFWGVALVIGLTWLLTRLGVPSVLFCWSVWIAFGQSAGAYVSPRTWLVMYLAAAAAMLYFEQPRAIASRRRHHRSPYVETVASSPTNSRLAS